MKGTYRFVCIVALRRALQYVQRGDDNPVAARQMAGYQFELLHCGMEQLDWQPLASFIPGMDEIRVRHAGGHSAFQLR